MIRRILLQTQYARSPEALAIRTAVLLAENSTPVIISDDPGACADDMPVGAVTYVLNGLRMRRIATPPVLNYPQALWPYLHREVWPSLLGKEIGSTTWIKGAGHTKPFMPGPASRKELRLLDPKTPVFASTPVRWLCEWRCYVAGGEQLWRERYDPDGADDAPEPDDDAIDAMLNAYEASDEAPAGYALDVGVLDDGRTALVEVNDGYALGFYGRVTPDRSRAYLRLLIRRYEQILMDGPLNVELNFA